MRWPTRTSISAWRMCAIAKCLRITSFKCELVERMSVYVDYYYKRRYYLCQGYPRLLEIFSFVRQYSWKGEYWGICSYLMREMYEGEYSLSSHKPIFRLCLRNFTNVLAVVQLCHDITKYFNIVNLSKKKAVE